MRLRFAVYGVLLLLAAYVALNWDLVVDNIDGLRAGEVDMTLPLDELSGNTTEASLARQYGRDNWRCIEDDQNQLGRRQCHVDARSVDGVRTLVIIFFFKRDRLAHAKIDLPNWEHRSGARMLYARYGQPTGAQTEFTQGVRLVGWRIQNGNVFYNRDRPLNPLGNTIFWMSHDEARATGGLFRARGPQSEK